MSRSNVGLAQLATMFPDADSARVYMEGRRWPQGTVCPGCQESKRITIRKGGFYRCNACKADFTVRTATIFERSHVSLEKWILAMHLLMTARKSVSSLQLGEEIGVTQKTGWFMLARIREACGNDPIPQLDKITDAVLSYTPNRKNSKAAPKSEPKLGGYDINLADAFSWMEAREASSIHAIVTDPPYGVKEYTDVEKAKLRKGRGGVWRIPPSFDGHQRSPVPRFTVLDASDIAALRAFFEKFAKEAMRVLVPGAHIMIATNPLLSQYVYVPMMEVGFEKRGEIIRLVQTLRGGDRPKNAHEEFPDVSVMPRSGWEPWGLFRKPCEGRVQDNLRKWQTGGLRRVSGEDPFVDVIRSSPTRNGEREIAPHPSLKPQAFMRQLVRAALPLGKGTVLDPFMGSGSTIAAASAVGYTSIGIEKDSAYFSVATKAIPALARYTPKDVAPPRIKLAAAKRTETNSHRKGSGTR